MKKLIALLLMSLPALGAPTEPDKAIFQPRNILVNPGAELGKTAWTASSGTFTTTTTAANVGSGNSAFSWDASASTQTLTSSAVTIPSGLFGRNIEASCNLKCASGTCTHTIGFWDGTTLTNTATITSNTTYTRTTINGIAASSGTLAIRITSAADEPILYLDDCYLGEARNLSQVSQAQLVGTLTFAPASSSVWTSTSTTYATMGTNSSAGTPTVTGSLSQQATTVPGFKISNAPPGNYHIVAQFTAGSTAAPECAFRFSDGTNSSAGTETDGPAGITVTLTGLITLTTAQTSWNVELQSKRSGGTNCIVSNQSADADRTLSFQVYRFPSTSEQAVRPDQSTSIWSGYHDNTCSWARSNTSYGDPTADTTCTFTESKNTNFGSVTSYLSGSDKLPGIVFTPIRTGTYWVCAMAKGFGSTAQINDLKLYDGTTTIAENKYESTNSRTRTLELCGLYTATSTASKTLRIETKSDSGSFTLGANGTTTAASIEWSIFQITGNMPAPVLVGSVTSNSSGALRTEHASVTSTCTSSPCTIALQSGSWVSSITRASTGNYTVNFVAGIFSSAPTCQVTVIGSLGYPTISSAPTTSSFNIETSQTGGSDVDRAFGIICMGPR
jgi:hypothetical protein